MRETIVMLN